MYNLIPETDNGLLSASAANIYNYTCEINRPSYIHKPKLTVDGNQWCALYGDDLQNGVAGFGDSPNQAYEDFDRNWIKSLTK
jgi:hypothetical protein